jgi:SNF2 family DNA or RNA helicase
MQVQYQEFLDSKAQLRGEFGFKPLWMPDFLFDFQKELVDWSLVSGRSAIFADCGLGKTPMQLVWAENVVRQTNKPVLILTPLAVSYQTIREGEKFGIDSHRIIDGSVPKGERIVVANYERLERFNPQDFAGVVCDESSILKNFAGVRRREITEFMRRVEYRLLCTATAAPNDYTELGTSSEALGKLGHMDMLSRFFKNQSNNSVDMKGRYRGFAAPRQWEQKQWRFRGHSETPFWQWVCSWARAIRRPSDLGFSDKRFELPPLREIQHTVEARTLADGMLFPMPAVGLAEQRAESKRTLEERCEKVAELVDRGEQSLVWCHRNAEGDLLEDLIPDAEQVAGSDTDERKESTLMRFADGDLRVLVTKPKIGAWGLNLQRCHHVTFFPSHSYEQYYQGVRRCWRFGQKNQVTVDVVSTEGEADVLRNLQRKSKAADKMFDVLVEHMSDALEIERDDNYPDAVEVPAWL